MSKTHQHFTAHDSAHSEEILALWDEICVEAEKVMTFGEWTDFIGTRWIETDGKSIVDCVATEDVESLTKIRDLMRKEVAAAEDLASKVVDGPVAFSAAASI